MADRPILFSAPMVRALLDGRKTQTRRVLKRARVFGTPETRPFTLSADDMTRALQNADSFQHLGEDGWFWEADAFKWQAPATRTRWLAHIGDAPGDRLYVRESWRVSPDAAEGWHPDHNRGWIDYQARGSAEMVAPSSDAVDRAAFTKADDFDWDCVPSRYRPGIHMPRWASRLTLTVTDVRIERLNVCSQADAIAEGIFWRPAPFDAWAGTDDPNWPLHTDPVRAYRGLWNTIHGRGAWEANPWVVAVGFAVERGNIDAMPGVASI